MQLFQAFGVENETYLVGSLLTYEMTEQIGKIGYVASLIGVLDKLSATMMVSLFILGREGYIICILCQSYLP